MRWPWVSRAGHERVAHDLSAALVQAMDLRAERDALRAKLDAMTERYTALLQSLATPKAKPKDPLAEVIRQESEGDPRLAAHFWKVARQAKAEGKSTEEVVGLIGWTSDSPVGTD